MNIQDQVCTLEQAKKFKDLGIIQESQFHWWWFLKDFSGDGPQIVYQGKLKARGTLSNVQECSAYTVAELGEMLPSGYDSMKITGNNPEEFYWLAYDLDGKECPPNRGCKTEAEARAALLIHLLESKLITTEETNKRLRQ